MIATQTLVVVSCYTCSIEYAIPERLNQKALDHPKGTPNYTQLFCPNGHAWVYIGETEAQKLKRQLEWSRDHAASLAADRDQARASLAATRGQVTKLRKRVVAGACPFGCRRHFADLARHVATKHEGKALAGEDAPE
jgi:hypothetical protein